MKSKANETDKERKSEDIDDEEIERSCYCWNRIKQQILTYCTT